MANARTQEELEADARAADAKYQHVRTQWLAVYHKAFVLGIGDHSQETLELEKEEAKLKKEVEKLAEIVKVKVALLNSDRLSLDLLTQSQDDGGY